MTLTIDVGNTTINIAVYDELIFIERYFLEAIKTRKSKDYRLLFNNLLQKYLNEIDGIIISSVVPEINDEINKTLEDLFKIKPMFLTVNSKTNINIKIDNPNELGSDLLCDAFGAIHSVGYPAIICDLGTASKLIIVDNNGDFCGCTIFPGIGISYNSLYKNASLLEKNDVNLPNKICSKNTKDAINSGILYGHIEEIKGLTRRIESEFGYKFKKVLTGGYANLIKDNLEEFEYNPYLINFALAKIYKLNK